MFLSILLLLFTTSTIAPPPPSPPLPSTLDFTVQSIQYTDHHVNMNHGSTIQFDVRVYDIWFDRSIFIMDDNGTVSPIATVSSRRLNAGGAPSVRVALGSPDMRELRSVYIHKRPNVGGTIGKKKKRKKKRKRERRREREEEEDNAEEEEEEEEEEEGDAEEETFAGNLHDEHRRALNIFKHQRRGRGRRRAKIQRRGRRQSRRNEGNDNNDDDDDNEMMRKRTREELREERRRRQEEEKMIGPLAERVHRFIEERTYHERPALHTNVLRISRVLCIFDQDDGLLYGDMENGMEEKEEKEEKGEKEEEKKKYSSTEEGEGEGEGGEVDDRRDVSFVDLWRFYIATNNNKRGSSCLLVVVVCWCLVCLFFFVFQFSHLVFIFSFFFLLFYLLLFFYFSQQSIHFQTLPEQRTDELMKTTTTSNTPPHHLLSITDHRGNTPNLAASSTKHRAYSNPLHPHVHHNILSSNGKKKYLYRRVSLILLIFLIEKQRPLTHFKHFFF